MNLLLAVLACTAVGADGDPLDLPTSLFAEPAEPKAAETLMSWTLGPRLGYANSSDADHGTWLVGGQVRLHIFSWLAAEASIEGRRDEYEGGDADVLTIPIQLTGIVYLPVDWAIRPYALAGFGWYYTDVHYSGSLSSLSDDSEVDFGGHAGLGAEWQLTPSLSLNVDIRWVWRDEPPRLKNDFDFYEVTAGVNFKLGK